MKYTWNMYEVYMRFLHFLSRFKSLSRLLNSSTFFR